jgi:peptidoglycan/xylan/chitin deacetylase (PgdA/CDA1 family)
MAIAVTAIEIISLEENLRSIKLRIRCTNGESSYFRCRLDPFTYKNLEKIFIPELLKKKIEGIQCVFPLNKSTEDGKEFIIWKTYGQETVFSFWCSPQFQLLLNQLRTTPRTQKLLDPIMDIYPGLYIPIIIKPVLTVLLTIVLIGVNPSPMMDSHQEVTGVISYDLEVYVMEQSSVSIHPELNHSLELQLEPGSIIYGVNSNQIALTFDDGPSPYTMQILDILNEQNVKATFFFLGQQLEHYPEAVAATIAQGSVVAWHSYSHSNLPGKPRLEQEQEILSRSPILDTFDYQVTLFRPPYGNYDQTTKEILEEHGMTMVLWNRDPKDWRATSSDEVINKVFDTDPSGGIYVLHETQATVNALPSIIEELKSRDLQFVTLVR